MVAWQVWLIIAGICLVIEIATVGFLVFWFAVAALITCLFSLFIHSLLAQTAIFVIFSAILVFLTRPFSEKISRKDSIVTNANSIIGKEAIVKKEISPNNNGQVKINGDTWTATLDSSCNSNIPEGSSVEILKIDGVKVVVKPIQIKEKEPIN